MSKKNKLKIDEKFAIPYNVTVDKYSLDTEKNKVKEMQIESGQEQTPAQNKPTEQVDCLKNISTEGFLHLRSISSDFQIDDNIDRLNEQLEEVAAFVDSFKKLTELIDPKRIDREILNKVLETMNEVAENYK